MQKISKNERLRSKKQIKDLFENGTYIAQDFFKFIFNEQDKNKKYPVRILIAVPKIKVAKSIDRNRIKRYIREAYRTNKSDLHSKLNHKNKSINLAIIYQNKEGKNFNQIEKKIKLLLRRLINEI